MAVSKTEGKVVMLFGLEIIFLGVYVAVFLYLCGFATVTELTMWGFYGQRSRISTFHDQ